MIKRRLGQPSRLAFWRRRSRGRASISAIRLASASAWPDPSGSGEALLDEEDSANLYDRDLAKRRSRLKPEEMELTSRAAFLAATTLLSFSLSACMGANGESLGAAPHATQFSTVIKVPGTAEELTNRFFAYTGPVQSKQVLGNTVQFQVKLTCETQGVDQIMSGSPEYFADATIESRDNRARISMSNFIGSTYEGATLEHMQSMGAPHNCNNAFQRFADELATAAGSAANEDW